MSERHSFDVRGFTIAASSSTDAWFQLWGALGHFDGESWTVESLTCHRNTRWGAPAAGMFFVSDSGGIYQRRAGVP